MSSQNKELLCLVGSSGAGKDEVANRVKFLTGAGYVSLSDQVRKQAVIAGLKDPSRSDLQLFANSMRGVSGNGVFATLSVAEVAQRPEKIIVINGVRNPDEVKIISQESKDRNVIIIGVNTSREKRFGRILKRGRPSDPKSWEEFLICDERENGTLDDKDGQQNYQCLALADLSITNENDSLDRLHFTVDLLIDRLISVGHLRNYNPEVGDNIQDRDLRAIITNGIHGAGKTTLGIWTASRLEIPFYGEIGRALREEVDYSVLQSSVDFDREVMRREITRDHRILQDTSQTACVIETWHTGNLAYIQERSPQLYASYLNEFRRHIGPFNPFHIFYEISEESFLNRVTERVSSSEIPNLAKFYRRIGSNIIGLYEELTLKYRVLPNDGDFELARDDSVRLAASHLR